MIRCVMERILKSVSVCRDVTFKKETKTMHCTDATMQFTV